MLKYNSNEKCSVLFSQPYFRSFGSVNRLRYFYVIPCTVILPFARVCFAGIAAAASHLPAALVALGKVFVAFRVGAVDHFIRMLATVKTGGNDYRVNAIHIH